MKNTMNMNTRIITVTPEQAAAWLAAQGKNRPVNRGRVAAFARQMKNGGWRVTHQGIAFDEDGGLVDGQHRLAAVIEAGVSVAMMATWGISRDVMKSAVDRQSKRTAAHAFSIDGETNAHAKSAVCRTLWTLENADIGYSDASDHDALTAVLERHRPAIEHCLAQSGSLRPNAPVVAVSVLMFYGNRGEEWYRGLVTGESLGAGDPRLHLRNWLLTGKKLFGTGRGASMVIEVLARSLSAADAWLNGETMVKLYTSEKRYTHWCKRMSVPVNTSVLAAISRN